MESYETENNKCKEIFDLLLNQNQAPQKHILKFWIEEIEKFDDVLSRTVQKLREKFLRQMIFKGYQGWNRSDYKEKLEISIREHIEKGDLIDVILIAIFLDNLKNTK